jgi:hypothetical protein
MSRKEFIELTGELPEDMFGENWREMLKNY